MQNKINMEDENWPNNQTRIGSTIVILRWKDKLEMRRYWYICVTCCNTIKETKLG